MTERIADDIEITHGGGQTIVRGVERDQVKELRDRAKNNSSGDSSLIFRGVRKIDVLRPGTSDPQQTILGEPGEHS